VNERHVSTWWPSKRIQRLLLAAALALALIGAACAFLRISHPHDIEAFLGMAAECHPVWKQFAFRRYGAGDSAPELFAAALRRGPPNLGVTECSPSARVPPTVSLLRVFQSSPKMGNFFRLHPAVARGGSPSLAPRTRSLTANTPPLRRPAIANWSKVV